MTGQNALACLKQELMTVQGYLIAAQDVVKSGYMPELSGLEDRIAALCESIQKAMPDTRKECLPELLMLLDHLNACEKNMRELHEGKMPKGNVR